MVDRRTWHLAKISLDLSEEQKKIPPYWDTSRTYTRHLEVKSNA